MISKSFFETLELIASEKELDINRVLKKVETAMQIACKNSDVPYKGDIRMEADFEKKKIKFWNVYYVVDEIDPTFEKRGQILVEEAKKIKPRVKAGSEIKEEVNLSTFKRKAASMFKQNFLNEITNLEREEAYNYFKDKVGEVLTGKVTNIGDGYAVLNLKKGVDVTIFSKDAIPGEKFEIGQEKQVYVASVESTTKGPKIMVNRNSKDMVRKVFEMNIPEIRDGLIEIVGIAREPGSRTKIGVASIKSEIDPKGSCVGPAGSRIKAINNILNGEKIDIFVWKSNPVDLIAEALMPAHILSVMPKEREKKALVICSEDQLSLAIGKAGQNVKLAAYATGWKIDIKRLADAYAEDIKINYNVVY